MIGYSIKRILLFIQDLIVSLHASGQIILEDWVKTADTREFVPYAIIMNVNSKQVFACNEQGYFKIAVTSISIFNIDLVQRIDFSGGGFSAEYSNALGLIFEF